MSLCWRDQVIIQPLNDAAINLLKAHNLLQMNDDQIKRLQQFLVAKIEQLKSDDQNQPWVSERRKYYLEGWRDDFFLLSEIVESPIEQQLGGYLLCISDGYDWVKFDFAPGAFPDPDFGTYFRCQQDLYGFRLDFLFKTNMDADWKALNVECDGHPFHERTKEQAARDRRRDRYLINNGVQVIRFSGSEIYNKPRKCAAEVEAVLSGIMWDLLSEHGKSPRRRPPVIPS